MKKTYISPAIHIMAVQMQQHMLIGSKVYDDFADTEKDVQLKKAIEVTKEKLEGKGGE